jgi:capsular polysaccharide biosynthesis protein
MGTLSRRSPAPEAVASSSAGEPRGGPPRFEHEALPGRFDADPPTGLFGRAARRFWWLIALLAVVCAAIGVAAGTQRDPVYTAANQLNVGTLDAQTQAVPGYVEAAKSLASSYSRLAVTDDVLAPVGQKVGLSAKGVKGLVSVTPVTDNPIITVRAEGSSEPAARRLSDTLADQLVTSVSTIDRRDEQTARLLNRFRAASQRASRYEEELRTLRARRENDAASVSLTRIERAQSRAETERLQAQALSTQYSSAAARGTGAAGIERFGEQSVSNDRSRKIQQLGLVGAIAGAALGLAGAVLLTARRRTRGA